MTVAPLPDSWDDEPWPLDDLDMPAPLTQRTWSDTHAEPPQVGPLADEAWQYAIDHGVSMERALAELQRREVRGSAAGVTYTISPGSWIDWTKFDKQVRQKSLFTHRTDSFIRARLDEWKPGETS